MLTGNIFMQSWTQCGVEKRNGANRSGAIGSFMERLAFKMSTCWVFLLPGEVAGEVRDAVPGPHASACVRVKCLIPERRMMGMGEARAGDCGPGAGAGPGSCEPVWDPRRPGTDDLPPPEAPAPGCSNKNNQATLNTVNAKAAMADGGPGHADGGPGHVGGVGAGPHRAGVHGQGALDELELEDDCLLGGAATLPLAPPLTASNCPKVVPLCTPALWENEGPSSTWDVSS